MRHVRAHVCVCRYLRHCAGEHGGALEEASPTAQLLAKASKLLQLVVKMVPGLLDGQMLLAKAHFLRGDYDGALRCCVACNKVDPSFAGAALLHAQILLRLEKYRQANQVMEQVLSHNFGIRDAPLFHLVKARLLMQEKEYAAAEPACLFPQSRLACALTRRPPAPPAFANLPHACMPMRLL